MKKSSEKRPVLNRIRTKMFISLFAILTVFFGVICFVAGPALSTVLIYRTYNNLKEISEEIDMVSPGSSTYYFDLYTIAVNNNISFELINQDDTISYQSSDGYSAQIFILPAHPIQIIFRLKTSPLTISKTIRENMREEEKSQQGLNIWFIQTLFLQMKQYIFFHR